MESRLGKRANFTPFSGDSRSHSMEDISPLDLASVMPLFPTVFTENWKGNLLSFYYTLSFLMAKNTFWGRVKTERGQFGGNRNTHTHKINVLLCGENPPGK